MIARPRRRNSRRPQRSSTGPSAKTLTNPAIPFMPITNPTVRSEPPSARTCSGSRKNDANVMKKQKFATVTRRNAGDSSEAPSDLPVTASQYTCPAMASERQREIRRRRKRRKESTKLRDREHAKEVRRQRASRKGKG